MRRFTIDKFIEMSKRIHGDKYNYDSVDYVNNKTKVVIGCPEHGNFEQVAGSHLRGYGCNNCSISNRRSTFDVFKEKALRLHNNKYSYIAFDYKNNLSVAPIICPEHGLFHQAVISHLSGKGCSLCKADNNRLSKDDFVKKAIEIHGDLYDYSLVDYNRCSEKVDIICRKHGVFSQTPTSHIHGAYGCYMCKNSKGELAIRKFLIKNEINFQQQKMFDGCVSKQRLKFDFYLPKKLVCIEFDGRQHYEFVPLFHRSEDVFKEHVKRDRIKDKYCLNNGIKLIRIKHDQVDDIGGILKSIL